MSYIPYTWVSGELITVDKLNNMEAGASEVLDRLQNVQEEINRATSEAIESIPKDYTVMDQEIRKLKAKDSRYAVCFANSLTSSKSGTGQVTIQDAWEAPLVEMEIGGVSAQVVTTGANLLSYPYPSQHLINRGITFTANDKGGIKIEGTSDTENATFSLSENLSLSPGKYCKNIAPSGCTFIISRYLKSTGAYEGLEASMNQMIFDTTSWDYDTYLYKARLQVPAIGTKVDAIFYPMICAGETLLPWEPYSGGVPSPSPEWPQEIQSVGDGGNLVVTMRGGNQVSYPYRSQALTSLGITFTSDEEGVVSIKGTSTDAYVTYMLHDNFMLSSGKYCKSVFPNSAGCNFMVSRYTKDGRYDGVEVSGKSDRFDTSYWDYEIYKYRLLIQVEKTGTTVDTVFCPMICAGETLLPWEPYHSKTITIPLAEPLRGIGATWDRIAYKDGEWGIERKIHKFPVTADTPVYSLSEIDGDYRRAYYNTLTNTSKAKGDIPSFCDKFTYKKMGGNVNLPGIGYFLHMGSADWGIYYRIGIGVPPDLDTAKKVSNWIDTIGGANFYFPIDVPGWEPFPDNIQATINSLTTYQDTTVIITPDAPYAPLTVAYVQDTRKVIDALELDMAEQITELQAQIDQLKITNNLS